MIIYLIFFYHSNLRLPLARRTVQRTVLLIKYWNVASHWVSFSWWSYRYILTQIAAMVVSRQSQLFFKSSSFSNMEQLKSCKIIVFYPGFPKDNGEAFWKPNSESMLIVIKKLRRIKWAAKVKDVVGILKDAFHNLIKCLLLSSLYSMPFYRATFLYMASVFSDIIGC